MLKIHLTNKCEREILSLHNQMSLMKIEYDDSLETIEFLKAKIPASYFKNDSKSTHIPDFMAAPTLQQRNEALQSVITSQLQEMKLLKNDRETVRMDIDRLERENKSLKDTIKVIRNEYMRKFNEPAPLISKRTVPERSVSVRKKKYAKRRTPEQMETARNERAQIVKQFKAERPYRLKRPYIRKNK